MQDITFGITLFLLLVFTLSLLVYLIKKESAAVFSLKNILIIVFLSGTVSLLATVVNVQLHSESRVERATPPIIISEKSYLTSEQQFEIGRDFYVGKDLPKDEYQSVKWLLLASSQGHSDAKELLSLLGYFSQQVEGAVPTSQFEVTPAKQIKLRLKDVAGMSEAKEEAIDLLTFIKTPDRYKSLGVRPPKGILLYGPPGNGKTYLAKAIAGEAGINFISTSGAAFEEQYVGVGAARIRELFQIAKQNRPCIIFIDELDAVAPSRKKEGVLQTQVQTLNQLLAEMSNLDSTDSEGIFIIAATNRLESLDDALIRPGRFDRQIYVRLPSLEDRKELIKFYFSKTKVSDDVSIDTIAQQTSGFSAAELEALVNEAGIYTGKNKKNKIDQESIEYAIKKISMYERDPNPNLQVSILSPYEIKTRFKDIAGMNEAKKEVTDVIDFLQQPEKYNKLGANIPKGIIIYGPPGTGKTMMARAIAGEAKSTFLSVSGSDFDDKWVGVGASRVRELFKTARKFKPCIIFIDEIDALAPQRGSSNSQIQTINQLLAEMDNIKSDSNEGIIVIGATNQLEQMDSALLRPGRFDRKIYFRLPYLRERTAIIEEKLGSKPYSKEISFEAIAKMTPGFSGADITNLINEAAIYSANENKDTIDMSAIEYAKDKIVLGLDMGTEYFTPEEIELTAVHEAGHALVGILHPDFPKDLHKVTVGLRGHSLGVTHFDLKSEKFSYTKRELEALISVFMGGYVAEEIVFGKDNITTGASSDLQAANSIVKSMINNYAMTDKQSFIVQDILGISSSSLSDEAEKILKRCYENAKSVIEKNRDKLNDISNALIKYETLNQEEVLGIVKGNAMP